MAEEKKPDRSQSFSRLLRGSAATSETPAKEHGSRPLSLQGEAASKGQEGKEKRRLLNLPFLRGGDKDGPGLAIGYKEWTFLLSAILLFFGGLGLVRYLAPKEGPMMSSFEIPPTDIEDGSRPPSEGEPTDELVSGVDKLRDTTRLVTPLDMGKRPEAAKDEGKKGPADQMKDGFWSGLREAEKGSRQAPRLPGMLGILNSLLGGGGGGGMPPIRPMSPEEIAAKVRGIPSSPPGGAPGMRLSYSGAQNAPGAARTRRSKYSSSGDEFNKARQAARDKLNNLYGGAEQQAAQVANKFGEGQGAPATGGGATTGGESPGIQKQEPDNVDYKLGRDPIADKWAEWELEKKKKMWDATWGKLIEFGMKEVIGGCNPPRTVTWVNGGPAADNLAVLGCDVAIYDDIVGVSQPREILDQGARLCHMDISGIYKEPTTGGEKETAREVRQSGSCRVPVGPPPATVKSCGDIKVTGQSVPGGCTNLSGAAKMISALPKALIGGLGSLASRGGGKPPTPPPTGGPSQDNGPVE